MVEQLASAPSEHSPTHAPSSLPAKRSSFPKRKTYFQGTGASFPSPNFQGNASGNYSQRSPRQYQLNQPSGSGRHLAYYDDPQYGFYGKSGERKKEEAQRKQKENQKEKEREREEKPEDGSAYEMPKENEILQEGFPIINQESEPKASFNIIFGDEEILKEFVQTSPKFEALDLNGKEEKSQEEGKGSQESEESIEKSLQDNLNKEGKELEGGNQTCLGIHQDEEKQENQESEENEESQENQDGHYYYPQAQREMPRFPFLPSPLQYSYDPNYFPIKLNIGGRLFTTCYSTLSNFPSSRFSLILKGGMYPNPMGEYFFDRDPSLFETILAFMRTAKLHKPPHQSFPELYEEARFYGIEQLMFPQTQRKFKKSFCKTLTSKNRISITIFPHETLTLTSISGNGLLKIDCFSSEGEVDGDYSITHSCSLSSTKEIFPKKGNFATTSLDLQFVGERTLIFSISQEKEKEKEKERERERERENELEKIVIEFEVLSLFDASEEVFEK